MKMNSPVDRRSFIGAAAAIASTAVLGGTSFPVFAEESKSSKKVGVEEVSPVEDLMREHGGLNRILLIYDEAIQRIDKKKEIDPSLIQKSATIIHDFIEGYHEKLEEEFIFPKLKAAGRLVDLVNTLKFQHDAGRKVTAAILELSTAQKFKNTSDRERLANNLRAFIRMYRPHEAREDTVVFPEFKKVVTPKEYDVLGDKFEDREHELFGKEGFDGIVFKISEIEKALGIYDLSQFTPKTS